MAVLQHKHTFKFRFPDGQIVTSPATVKRPSRGAVITLTEEHLVRAMEDGGMSNTQTCAGAVCTKEHKNFFSHGVTGHVDWQYTRVYISSKNDAKTNLPIECYVYAHSDGIARLFDKKGGYALLLDDIRENGPKPIRLYPTEENRTRPTGKRKGKVDGSRSSRPLGAKLRLHIANIQLGLTT